jgi:hypothetical protein
MARGYVEAPLWLRRALLGVCYWVGHRRALYRRHPLWEGAIVAELCNLISANLDKPYELHCEVPYSRLVSTDGHASRFTERSRVDLCVVQRNESKKARSYDMVIEVKRGSSSQQSIQADLARLAGVKRQLPRIRALLIIVAEKMRPHPYVTVDGQRSKKLFTINRYPGHHYRVLSVQKAVYALGRLDDAHYACALEILAK